MRGVVVVCEGDGGLGSRLLGGGLGGEGIEDLATKS
jgi:hypothetical protein